MKTIQKNIFLLITFLVVGAFIIACSDDELTEPAPILQPEIIEVKKAVTGEVTDIEYFSAMISGQANLDTYENCTIQIEYSTDSDFQDYSWENVSEAKHLFVLTLKRLQPETTYYYRTVVRINNGYQQKYYGETKMFTTKAVILQEEGAVDLGLSVKWAARNLGANKPEQYGSYIEWGETSEKGTLTYYDFETYKHIDIGENISGTQYDAARAQWGEGWRMPTMEECVELATLCEHRYITYKEVKGCLFVAPNGNCIFLPAAGDKSYKGEMRNENDHGYYWSGTAQPPLFGSGISGDAYEIYFYNDDVTADWDSSRLFFNTIRPVTD